MFGKKRKAKAKEYDRLIEYIKDKREIGITKFSVLTTMDEIILFGKDEMLGTELRIKY